MTKNMKKFMTAVSFVAVVSVISPVFGGVSIFNRSLANQAGLAYDSVLDTWDYLTIPSLFGELKGSALEFGLSNDDKLTGNNNTLFFGSKFNLGAPLLLAVSLRNAGTSSSDDGSTFTNAGGTTTNNNVTKTNVLNSIYKVALGYEMGTMGIQLFGDFRANGRLEEFSSSTNTGANVKSETYKFNDGGTYNQFGLNWGTKMGDTVINAGLSYKSSAGSSYEAASADGNISVNVKNFQRNAAANVDFTADAAAALAGENYLTAANLRIDSGNSFMNQRSGLVFSTFGWLPMALLTQKDVIGWVATYEASTMFGSENYSYSYKNGTTDDYTATFDTKSSGLGTLNINPYLRIPFSLGEVGNLYVNIDLALNITGAKLETDPVIKGKRANADLSVADISNGFITLDGALNCGPGNPQSIYCDKTTIEVSDMSFALGLPVIAEININKQLTWITGAFGKITYRNAQKTTTITEKSDTKAYTSVVSKSNDVDNDGNTDSGITTSIAMSTGLKYKPADNLAISLLATGSTTAITSYQFSGSVSYIFK